MFESKRQFKLWDYNVSHEQLLVRSPRTGGETHNLDIVFWGVNQVFLSSTLPEVAIRRATLEDGGRTLGTCAAVADAIVFLVSPKDDRHFVVAAGCKVLRNDLEIFDSSLVYFDRDRSKEEYGVVVAQP